MIWVVRLTSPEGDTVYGEAIDRDGIRYRCKNACEAEFFSTKLIAQSSFDSFRAMEKLQGYKLEAVEILERPQI